MKSADFFDKVSKYSLYLLAFLVPLWVLPFTQDVSGYQKQVLLVVLVFLGVVSFLAKAVNQGSLTFRQSSLHILVLLFLGSVALSTLFSIAKGGSFWGWPLDTADNLLSFLALGLLYFFIANSLEKQTNLFSLGVLGVSGAALAGAFTLLQLYGVHLIPFDFAKASGFNPIGTTNSVALLSAVLLPLALTLGFASKVGLRWLLFGEAFVLFLVASLINFADAWIALLVGVLVLLGFGMWNLRKRTEFGWISFPMALLVVGLFFLVFPLSIPGSPATPTEVSPSQSSELGIVKNVLAKQPLFGSGPGTFAFDYSKFRPEALNQTIFWGTRFASGASAILDFAATKGILGLLAFAGVVGAALFLGLKSLARTAPDNFSWLMGLGFFASFAGMSAAAFLYPWQNVLWFYFFLLLGALGVFIGKEPKTVSIAPPSFLAVVSSFVFLIVLIFGLGVLFIGGQKYAAEVFYLQAVRASQQGNQDQAISSLLRSVRLNRSVDLYWRDLGQLYLGQVNRIGADTKMAQEEKTKQLQTAVSNAIASVQQATRVSPENVANWNVQGFVYRNLIGFAGAEGFAISSYEKAAELEPASPFNVTELARVYVLQGQNLANQKGKEKERDEALAKAQEELAKALELKNDYAPAHFLFAVIYDQQGKTEEAIKKLEEVKNADPNNSGLAFQLGVVYWQKQRYEKAQEEFERALKLNANYDNAKYMLGLVYDKRGQPEKAKEVFVKLVETNPNNTEVKTILANLTSGKPALEGITPGQPPLEETPPEIQQGK